MPKQPFRVRRLDANGFSAEDARMNTRLGAVGLTLALGLVVAMAAPAFARGGPGGGGFAGGGMGGGMMMSRGFSGGGFSPMGYPPGFSSPGGRVGWGGASTPPGWSHGMKRGWQNRGMPPGLYCRQYGC
jgi:hypothetical protein